MVRADAHRIQPRVSRRRPSSAARSLLLGRAAFEMLKAVQAEADQPRLDLRYFVEGAIVLLDGSPALNAPWLQAARSALADHLQVPLDLPKTSGTGTRPHTAAEGAQARTHGGHRPSARHADCKSLQIGETSFERLKAIQGTTHAPRLEMRYLIEGGICLLRSRADQQAAWVWQARQALIEHLTCLQQLPVQPTFLEQVRS